MSSTLDRKRWTAVQALESIGATFEDGAWSIPSARQAASCLKAADRMHALLMERADELAGCTEGSPEVDGLIAVTDAILAYEIVRWPEME